MMRPPLPYKHRQDEFRNRVARRAVNRQDSLEIIDLTAFEEDIQRRDEEKKKKRAEGLLLEDDEEQVHVQKPQRTDSPAAAAGVEVTDLETTAAQISESPKIVVRRNQRSSKGEADDDERDDLPSQVRFMSLETITTTTTPPDSSSLSERTVPVGHGDSVAIQQQPHGIQQRVETSSIEDVLVRRQRSLDIYKRKSPEHASQTFLMSSSSSSSRVVDPIAQSRKGPKHFFPPDNAIGRAASDSVILSGNKKATAAAVVESSIVRTRAASPSRRGSPVLATWGGDRKGQRSIQPSRQGSPVIVLEGIEELDQLEYSQTSSEGDFPPSSGQTSEIIVLDDMTDSTSLLEKQITMYHQKVTTRHDHGGEPQSSDKKLRNTGSVSMVPLASVRDNGVRSFELLEKYQAAEEHDGIPNIVTALSAPSPTNASSRQVVFHQGSTTETTSENDGSDTQAAVWTRYPSSSFQQKSSGTIKGILRVTPCSTGGKKTDGVHQATRDREGASKQDPPTPASVDRHARQASPDFHHTSAEVVHHTSMERNKHQSSMGREGKNVCVPKRSSSQAQVQDRVTNSEEVIDCVDKAVDVSSVKAVDVQVSRLQQRFSGRRSPRESPSPTHVQVMKQNLDSPPEVINCVDTQEEETEAVVVETSDARVARLRKLLSSRGTKPVSSGITSAEKWQSPVDKSNEIIDCIDEPLSGNTAMERAEARVDRLRTRLSNKLKSPSRARSPHQSSRQVPDNHSSPDSIGKQQSRGEGPVTDTTDARVRRLRKRLSSQLALPANPTEESKQAQEHPFSPYTHSTDKPSVELNVDEREDGRTDPPSLLQKPLQPQPFPTEHVDRIGTAPGSDADATTDASEKRIDRPSGRLDSKDTTPSPSSSQPPQEGQRSSESVLSNIESNQSGKSLSKQTSTSFDGEGVGGDRQDGILPERLASEDIKQNELKTSLPTNSLLDDIVATKMPSDEIDTTADHNRGSLSRNVSKPGTERPPPPQSQPDVVVASTDTSRVADVVMTAEKVASRISLLQGRLSDLDSSSQSAVLVHQGSESHTSRTAHPIDCADKLEQKQRGSIISPDVIESKVIVDPPHECSDGIVTATYLESQRLHQNKDAAYGHGESEVQKVRASAIERWEVTGTSCSESELLPSKRPSPLQPSCPNDKKEKQEISREIPHPSDYFSPPSSPDESIKNQAGQSKKGSTQAGEKAPPSIEPDFDLFRSIDSPNDSYDALFLETRGPEEKTESLLDLSDVMSDTKATEEANMKATTPLDLDDFSTVVSGSNAVINDDVNRSIIQLLDKDDETVGVSRNPRTDFAMSDYESQSTGTSDEGLVDSSSSDESRERQSLDPEGKVSRAPSDESSSDDCAPKGGATTSSEDTVDEKSIVYSGTSESELEYDAYDTCAVPCVSRMFDKGCEWLDEASYQKTGPSLLHRLKRNFIKREIVKTRREKRPKAQLPSPHGPVADGSAAASVYSRLENRRKENILKKHSRKKGRGEKGRSPFARPSREQQRQYQQKSEARDSGNSGSTNDTHSQSDLSHERPPTPFQQKLLDRLDSISGGTPTQDDENHADDEMTNGSGGKGRTLRTRTSESQRRKRTPSPRRMTRSDLANNADTPTDSDSTTSLTLAGSEARGRNPSPRLRRRPQRIVTESDDADVPITKSGVLLVKNSEERDNTPKAGNSGSAHLVVSRDSGGNDPSPSAIDNTSDHVATTEKSGDEDDHLSAVQESGPQERSPGNYRSSVCVAEDGHQGGKMRDVNAISDVSVREADAADKLRVRRARIVAQLAGGPESQLSPRHHTSEGEAAPTSPRATGNGVTPKEETGGASGAFLNEIAKTTARISETLSTANPLSAISKNVSVSPTRARSVNVDHEEIYDDLKEQGMTSEDPPVAPPRSVNVPLQVSGSPTGAPSVVSNAVPIVDGRPGPERPIVRAEMTVHAHLHHRGDTEALQAPLDSQLKNSPSPEKPTVPASVKADGHPNPENPRISVPTEIDGRSSEEQPTKNTVSTEGNRPRPENPTRATATQPDGSEKSPQSPRSSRRSNRRSPKNSPRSPRKSPRSRSKSQRSPSSRSSSRARSRAHSPFDRSTFLHQQNGPSENFSAFFPTGHSSPEIQNVSTQSSATSPVDNPDQTAVVTQSIATLNDDERVAALELVEKLRRRAETLKRRRQVRQRRMKHLEEISVAAESATQSSSAALASVTQSSAVSSTTAQAPPPPPPPPKVISA